MASLQAGDCVRVPDGRPGRVRGREGGRLLVRVRRPGSTVDELLLFRSAQLSRIAPPSGWMTAQGYRRRLAAARRNAKIRREAGSTPKNPARKFESARTRTRARAPSGGDRTRR